VLPWPGMRCSERPTVGPAGPVKKGPRREAKGQMLHDFFAQHTRNFKMRARKLARWSRFFVTL